MFSEILELQTEYCRFLHGERWILQTLPERVRISVLVKAPKTRHKLMKWAEPGLVLQLYSHRSQINNSHITTVSHAFSSPFWKNRLAILTYGRVPGPCQLLGAWKTTNQPCLKTCQSHANRKTMWMAGFQHSCPCPSTTFFTLFSTPQLDLGRVNPIWEQQNASHLCKVNVPVQYIASLRVLRSIVLTPRKLKQCLHVLELYW